MKVYVASSVGAYEDAYKLMEVLRNVGHTVAHDWTEDIRNGRHGIAGGLAPATRKALAVGDMQAVRRADALVLLYRPNMRGAWCEVGAALALQRSVIVLDDKMVLDDDHDACVFLAHPNVMIQCTNTGVISALYWTQGILDIDKQLKRNSFSEEAETFCCREGEPCRGKR